MRMKALFRPATLLLAPLLLLGATDEKPRLAFQGLGSIEIGTSEAVLQKRGFSDPYRSAHSQADEEYAACHYLSNETEYPGVHFMINEGRLVRIDIGENDAGIMLKSLSGASIGMTETEIVSLYGDWIKIDRHPYLDAAGSYLILDSSDGRYKMIFETATSDGSGEQLSSKPSGGPNANKRVTDFRAGLAGPANYIEGCS
tara:strand:+ start:40071 stop:40670 length:600 start_codon:yes stop_codon:yes gene_type:complete